MKKTTLLFCMIIAIYMKSFAQNLDPLWDIWAYEHGIDFEEYVNSSGEINYYVTWSSSADATWNHEIFNKIISFDANGNIQVVQNDQNYIGGWEAQEPVITAINSSNNNILSVFEDGGQSNIPNEAVNVNAQLHKPDGTVIKEYFPIAVGPGAQHSPGVGHLDNRFLAFYGDDYSGASTQIRASVIDDETGEMTQSIDVTPAEEYHWWAVYTSNSNETVGLVTWVKDIEEVAGSIVTVNNGVVSTSPYQVYLTGAEFVYNRVVWLNEINRFAIISKTVQRSGNPSNSDVSLICLVDENGNKTLEAELQGAIIQEGEPAFMWDAGTQSYIFIYPSGNNDLIVAKVNNNEIINHSIIEGNSNSHLAGITWTNTGIMSKFIKDVNGNQIWNNQYIALFAMGNYDTDGTHLLPIHINTDIFGGASNNIPPVVAITSPLEGTEYTSSATVVIDVDASDSDGYITKVEFYQNGSLLGEDNTFPYNYEWSNVVEGSYLLTAVATDNNNASVTSAPINITSTTETGCVIYTIPEVIEAENYCDMFGVTEEPCSDINGGTDIGSFNQNDWLEYQVNVPSAGNYNVLYRIATPNRNTNIQLFANDLWVAETKLPNTGGWQIWESVTQMVYLEGGIQTLKLVNSRRKEFNLNWLELSGSQKSATVNVTEELESCLQIYPNPAENIICISNVESNRNLGKVQVLNMAGMVLFDLDVSNKEFVDISSLNKGVYIIKAGNEIKKFVKK